MLGLELLHLTQICMMGEIADKSGYPQSQNNVQIRTAKFLAHGYDFHNEI
jgi:hypothetical protein